MTSSDGRATGAAEAPAPPLDFIREIVAGDVAAGENGGARRHALPARAQRLPAHRPRQGDLPRLRRRRRVRRALQPALRRHQPGQGRRRVRRLDQGRRALARLRLGRPRVLRLGLLRAALRRAPSDSIRRGLAYVDSQSADEIRANRGTLTEPGRDSPYRERPWTRTSTCSGACAPASSPTARTCCAPRSTWRRPTSTCATRCSTASGTPSTTAPATRGASTRCTTTRIRCRTRSRASRTRCARSSSRTTGRCTTGWCANAGTAHTPRQIEFARLNLNYTVMSKRKLLQLVDAGPRRRAGTTRACRRSRACAGAAITPEAIRDFCARVGVAKKENVIDIGLLEHCVREDLNRRAPRAMAVLRPLKVVLTNYPEGQVETMAVVNNPEDPAAGTREVPFARELYIERDDFLEDPPKKFFRLAPGREVRLRDAYLVTCTEVVKDAAGDDRRAALHLRPGHARRRRAGRPQGEGHDPLGVGGARGRRRGAALRSPVHRRGSRRRRGEGRAGLHRVCSTRHRSTCSAAASSSRCSARPRPVRASSSSGSATSPSIRMARPARRSSTAPCRSRTRGRRSPRGRVQLRLHDG